MHCLRVLGRSAGLLVNSMGLAFRSVIHVSRPTSMLIHIKQTLLFTTHRLLSRL